jgi:hypothetical protein
MNEFPPKRFEVRIPGILLFEFKHSHAFITISNISIAYCVTFTEAYGNTYPGKFLAFYLK